MRVLEQDRKMRGLELDITRRYLNYGALGFANADERRDLSNRVADFSGGRNYLEWISDAAGTPLYFPSIYVRFGAERTPIAAAEVSAVKPHPAFIVDDAVVKDLFVGKYQGKIQASNSKNLLLSLRGLDPSNTQQISVFTTAAANNGATHHMMTNAEYSYLALKCKAQGFQPRGNNNYGADIAVASEKGEIASVEATHINRVLTGSGPIGWSHDGSPYGVWDLNGNVYEFANGLQVKNGLIKIVKNNDAALKDGTKNIAFKTILGDGTLASEGDAGQLSFVAAAADYGITVPASGSVFSSIPQVYQKPTDGPTACPTILKELCIIPHDAGEYGGDGFYHALSTENLCMRGGSWDGGALSGVFDLYVNSPLAHSSHYLGARPAFYRV